MMSRNITCYILSFSIIIIFNAMNEVIQNPMRKLELGRGNNKNKKMDGSNIIQLLYYIYHWEDRDKARKTAWSQVLKYPEICNNYW